MHDLIEAKFSIGIIVKHKFLHFRGVIFDVDPVFNNSEEWYKEIARFVPFWCCHECNDQSA